MCHTKTWNKHTWVTQIFVPIWESNPRPFCVQYDAILYAKLKRKLETSKKMWTVFFILWKYLFRNKFSCDSISTIFRWVFDQNRYNISYNSIQPLYARLGLYRVKSSHVSIGISSFTHYESRENRVTFLRSVCPILVQNKLWNGSMNFDETSRDRIGY